MSETTSSKEPIDPRTHLAIVITSKNLIAACLAADEAKGESSTLRVPVDPSVQRVEPDTPVKLIYEVYPKITPEWKGKFFTVEGGGAVKQFTISAPVDKSDPDQSVHLTALFDPFITEPLTAERYQNPSKQVIIPLAEALPELIENPHFTSAPETVLREERLDYLEGQDLLTDLQEILLMQQDSSDS